MADDEYATITLAVTKIVCMISFFFLILVVGTLPIRLRAFKSNKVSWGINLEIARIHSCFLRWSFLKCRTYSLASRSRRELWGLLRWERWRGCALPVRLYDCSGKLCPHLIHRENRHWSLAFSLGPRSWSRAWARIQKALLHPRRRPERFACRKQSEWGPTHQQQWAGAKIEWWRKSLQGCNKHQGTQINIVARGSQKDLIRLTSQEVYCSRSQLISCIQEC